MTTTEVKQSIDLNTDEALQELWAVATSCYVIGEGYIDIEKFKDWVKQEFDIKFKDTE